MSNLTCVHDDDWLKLLSLEAGVVCDSCLRRASRALPGRGSDDLDGAR